MRYSKSRSFFYSGRPDQQTRNRHEHLSFIHSISLILVNAKVNIIFDPGTEGETETPSTRH